VSAKPVPASLRPSDVGTARLRARIGLVNPAELHEVEAAVLITLGFSPP
jgi:hypothetical protein